MRQPRRGGRPSRRVRLKGRIRKESCFVRDEEGRVRGEGVGTPPGARKGGGRAAGVSGQGGFTLLEVLIVVFILGLLTAMVIPGLNQLDHRERTRITRERMELIRRAILGPEDRFDSAGRPLVGGYVGDMGAWPDLWEARAELQPTFAGTGWENPAALSTGLGQGPDYDMDPAKVFYRPSGSFAGGSWKWHRPYRRLRDDATNHYDHIGGLETENEGQPRGLWTRYPEELPFDLSDDYLAPGFDLGDNWKGPYLAPPLPQKGGGGQHLARSDADYAALEPIAGSWEDGDYNPVGGLGERFDDKEAFRLLQTDGRLADGWGRAFRFFITEDTAHPDETIFWIVSEGPDGAGFYPTKGSYSGGWSDDPDDTMAKNYDASHPLNRDNMVMKLYSRDWKGVFAAQDADRAEQTRRLLERIRVALVGDSPRGRNHGFTGDLGRWPKLFRWDGGAWDGEEAADTPYTKGQPRELWTRTPYSSDLSNKVDDSKWGFGWRHAYLGAPQGGPGENEVLRDAWGRELLFFKGGDDALLILSRGKDGKYSFDAEPDNYTEALNVGAYDPAAADNEDNLHLVVRASDWRSGYFRLDQLIVLNATVGVTKCRFFRDGGAPLAGDLLTALVLTDEDGDGLPNDWVAGSGPANPAFNFDDTTTQKVFTGARYLVCWNDTDGNEEIDSGEPHLPFIFNVIAGAGSGQFGNLTINSADFRSAP